MGDSFWDSLGDYNLGRLAGAQKTVMDNTDELNPHRKSEMKKAYPRFGDSLIPRYAFYLPTTHKENDIKDQVLERMKKVTATLPKESQAFAESFFKKKLETLKLEDSGKTEVHILVVAENKETGMFEGYGNNGHKCSEHPAFKGETAVEVGVCEDLDYAKAQMSFTSAKMSFDPQWIGERGTPKEIEADTFAEFMHKVEVAGIKEEFLAIYPNTQTTPSAPTVSAMQPLTPKRRKELVKRFGVKNIKALEDKIKKND